MKIGDLAQASATGVETIRYYERQGLLPLVMSVDARERSDLVALIRTMIYCLDPHCALGAD